jgi:hypothetical protein
LRFGLRCRLVLIAARFSILTHAILTSDLLTVADHEEVVFSFQVFEVSNIKRRFCHWNVIIFRIFRVILIIVIIVRVVVIIIMFRVVVIFPIIILISVILRVILIILEVRLGINRLIIVVLPFILGVILIVFILPIVIRLNFVVISVVRFIIIVRRWSKTW